jgi:hypothetical protein
VDEIRTNKQAHCDETVLGFGLDDSAWPREDGDLTFQGDYRSGKQSLDDIDAAMLLIPCEFACGSTYSIAQTQKIMHGRGLHDVSSGFDFDHVVCSGSRI